MMYDHEKSDPAIVAVKPTNKAGQPAAELVEPRAGAEGNVSQQSTSRAQYRGTVSQALKRMRNFVRLSRCAVTHPRWEPCARIGLARICAGYVGQFLATFLDHPQRQKAASFNLD
jgi:hypothetical protein